MFRAMQTVQRFFCGCVAFLILGLAPARAEVEVFDSKEEYLGALLQVRASANSLGESAAVQVFVPELGRVVQIDPATGSLVSDVQELWYTTANCAGNPQVGASLFMSVGWINGFYTGMKRTPSWIWARSCRRGGTNQVSSCQNTSYAMPMWAVPAMRVDLPFAVPASLPLHFKAD